MGRASWVSSGGEALVFLESLRSYSLYSCIFGSI